MMRVIRLTAACLTVFFVSLGRIQADYIITDLGALGASNNLGINDSGEVTGFAGFTGLGGSPINGFIYSGGVIQSLVALGGRQYSPGYSINNAGQVAGVTSTPNVDGNGGPNHAYLYSGGAMHDLGTLGPLGPNDNGSYESGAFAINNSGQVTGFSYSTGIYDAFLYSGGAMHDLGHGIGYGINDAGQVTGSNGEHAFLYSGGAMHDMGTLGGSMSIGLGINNSGQVVGWSETAISRDPHAFLYFNGSMHDLGTLGGLWSQAVAINNSGQVVGASETSDGSIHAFLYFNGVMTDLNSLVAPSYRGRLNYANGINNNGQIITGYGGTFLLTPGTPPPAIPEPTTFALFCFGGIALAIRETMKRSR